MSFLEKITGHRLRMHNTNRVMSNSVGIVCTLGVLSSLCDDIDPEHGVDSEHYERVCRLYKKTAQLVEESERTMDCALRLKMDTQEELLFPFVQACLVISEDVQRTYLDKLDQVCKRLPPTRAQADPAPEPEQACVICVGDLSPPGVRVPPCPECHRDDLCLRCDAQLDACPFCRTRF